MKLRHSFVFWLVVVALPIFSGCGSTSEKSGMSTISGEIIYRESVMLPTDAQITVSLEEVSETGSTSGVMVIKEFNPAGSPPYKFSLEYNSNWINPHGRYAISGRIDVDGKLLFSGTEYINIREKNKKGTVQVQVHRIDPSN